MVVNKGDRPGAQRTASQLRAMLVAVGRAGARGGVRATGHARAAPSAADAAAAERPRPKEPEVLVTTATTGDGIPELLATLDRHRARGRDASDTPARLARAEAQVWAILADRLRADLHVAREPRRNRRDDAQGRRARARSLQRRRSAPRHHAAMTAAEPTDGQAEARLFTREFATLSAAVLVFFVAGGILIPVTPLFTREVLLGDKVAVGIVAGAFAVASLLMRPFSGRLSRPARPPDRAAHRRRDLRRRRRRPSAREQLEILIVMRVLLGVGEALFFVAGLAAATDLAPEKRRGEAISLVSLSLYLGIAIGPLLGEFILDAWGYAAVWIVTTGLYVASVALSWIVPETLQRTRAADGSPAERSTR